MGHFKTQPCEIGRALYNLSRRWPRIVEREISSLGLTLVEFRVLRALLELDSSPMVKLARDQMITQASMTSIADKMEKATLIERIRSKADRRIVNVRITEKGRDLFKKGMRRYIEFMETVTRALSRQEMSQLLDALDKLLAVAEKQ